MPWAPPPTEPGVDPALTRAFGRALTAGRLGGPLVAFGEVGSTQAVARRYALAGAPEGVVVVADHQTAGRGRRGRRWATSPGTALLVSCILRPPWPPDRWPALGLAAACAVADAVAAEAGIEPTLKWPNDVLLGQRKVAGVLAEGILGEDPFAILGIGVNVLEPPAGWPPELAGRATSLAAAGGAVERARLLSAILERLAVWYDVLLDEGFEPLRGAWRRRGLLGGRVRTPAGVGVAADLAPDGALVVRLDGGETAVLRAGEADEDAPPVPGPVAR